MSLALMALGCGLFAPTLGLAQEPRDIDIQRFRPAMDSQGFITIERSKALGTLEPAIGLYMNYSFNPLTQEIDGTRRALIEQYGRGDILLALGFFSWVEIGAQLPVVILRGDADGPGDEPEIAGDGLGDAALSLKIKLLDRDRLGVGLALVPEVRFGAGEPGIFASHGGLSLGPKLALDWDLGSYVSMAINAGARLRQTRSLEAPITRTTTDAEGARRAETLTRADPIKVGNELTYGFGAGVQLIKDRLELVGEVFGAAPMIADAARANPLEALLGLRLFLVGNSFFTLGASRGLMQAYGDPDLRLWAGIVFEPSVGDRDGDGIPDDVDQCPDEAEDKDQFEDEDGCPDLDNDGDGIPDTEDLCPLQAEDRNGYEDQDGCPDSTRDRDGDGIIDSKDRCPDQAEDRDGFMDHDGCPDPDNDNDGILDGDDRCPMQAEDIDGFEDEDGCPDNDNDGDGIIDAKDRCPDEAENYNQVEDEDGCPDQEKKVVITGGQLKILEKVYFETGKSTIKTQSYEILVLVAETLNENPQITKLEVQGHTDSRGSEKSNLKLSAARAAAVRKFLIDQGNVAPDRLTSRGYGESKPLNAEESPSAWAQNRRVEFVILEEE
ncbi:OmpA family protein [Myxococcota bacterium]|nr:OmpA family protein [Myxococcota bacterium]MBU1430399.1 OmpA family protein [Myxococcota bacterium]MBU1897367.1 OmpA family protein [Myxococcota bacterium]